MTEVQNNILNNRPKAIGILGGMGPQASVYMNKMLNELAITHFNAKNPIDFPEIILHSIPAPFFISNKDDIPITLEILKGSVRNFNTLNVSCLSMACNSAHIMLDELQKVADVPFISMINQVVLAVKKDNIKKIGILGAQVTIDTKLYQNALQNVGIDYVVPDISYFSHIEAVISNVINGNNTQLDINILTSIADELHQKGAEGIILGCTELPLVFPKEYILPTYNSVKILCLALLERYYSAKA